MSASDSSTALRPEASRSLEAELAGLVGSVQEARWILEDARRAADPIAEARRLARRRAGGEPLQHVLSHWGFRRLAVKSDRRALVPRFETELVVEIALAEVASSRPLWAADLGTGSGVIALSLALELRGEVNCLATDISPAALGLARENAAASGLGQSGRLSFLQGSWYEALGGQLRGALDLVVSNPPYLAAREWEELDPVVRQYDPYEALVAGEQGTEAMAEILLGAPVFLKDDGLVVLELAPHQAGAGLELARRAGFSDARVAPDLAGRPRVLVARP